MPDPARVLGGIAHGARVRAARTDGAMRDNLFGRRSQILGTTLPSPRANEEFETI